MAKTENEEIEEMKTTEDSQKQMTIEIIHHLMNIKDEKSSIGIFINYNEAHILYNKIVYCSVLNLLLLLFFISL